MPAATAANQLNRADVVALYRQAVLSGIPIEKLDDKIAQLSTRSQVTERFEQQSAVERSTKITNRLPKLVRLGAILMPMALLSFGIYLVSSAIVPIASTYLAELPHLQAANLTSPIPQEQVMDVTPLIITQAKASSGDDAISFGEIESKPVIIDTELDYTNLTNWFGETTIEELAGSGQSQTEQTYLIDIPSVAITNASVTVGGSNLNKSLIQYPGTALPGEFGAPVIFGHSVLRQFYNPSEKNPRRYNSIFSKIMTLKNGDKIFVTHQNVKYTYIVQDKSVVKPSDVHILTQKYDARHLKLVTCVPEGTYEKRGVVTAVLIQTGE